MPSSTKRRASSLPDSVIWRHCANVLQTFPFFTSEPVTRTGRQRIALSALERVASGAKAGGLAGDTDAVAGAVTGADVAVSAKAEDMMPMAKLVNRIGRMCIILR